MKKLIYLMVLVVFWGCVSTDVIKLNAGFPPKAEDAPIDFLVRSPEKPFVEIGVIEVNMTYGSDYGTMQKHMAGKARELGADAVILTGGGKGSYVDYNKHYDPVWGWSSSPERVSTGKLQGLAIKYKEPGQ